MLSYVSAVALSRFNVFTVQCEYTQRNLHLQNMHTARPALCEDRSAAHNQIMAV